MAPFEWAKNFNYENYEQSIIEEDIIPDDLLKNIQQLITSYCGANYTTVKNSYNSDFSVECNDTPGNSNCSCDGQTYCYPANCSKDEKVGNGCKNYTPGDGICSCNACNFTYDNDANAACPKDGLEINKPREN